MKYKYDAKTDILMIGVGRGRPDFGEQKENIITHYNKHGKPIEIEILGASKTVAEIVDAVLNKRKIKTYA